MISLSSTERTGQGAGSKMDIRVFRSSVGQHESGALCLVIIYIDKCFDEMLRMGRKGGFVHTKVIICLIDALIVLLAGGYIFRLSLVNTEADQIRTTPWEKLCCQLCGGSDLEWEKGYCCESTEEGQCIKQKSKEQCRQEILNIKQQQGQFYQDNLIALIILGTLFFLIECYCDSCLNFVLNHLNVRRKNDDYSRLIKSGAISTLNLEENSSATSFSSLSDQIQGGGSALRRSFCYRMQEMACPACLQTMDQQRVVSLRCSHIMHSSCARLSRHNCPICQ